MKVIQGTRGLIKLLRAIVISPVQPSFAKCKLNTKFSQSDSKLPIIPSNRIGVSLDLEEEYLVLNISEGAL